MKVAAALTQGKQDILRAELFAICNVCENFDSGRIYTDNQAALILARLALSVPSVDCLLGKEHFDLLVRIWKRKGLVNFDLYKVKSHRDLTVISDPLVRYQYMGNHIIDRIAVDIREKFVPSLALEHQTAHKELELEQQHLSAIYKLFLQLLEAKGRAQNPEVPDRAEQCDYQTAWDKFERWVVPVSNFVLDNLETKFLEHSAFGADIAHLTINWLRCLSWPPENVSCLDGECGTSWLNWFSAGCCFPNDCCRLFDLTTMVLFVFYSWVLMRKLLNNTWHILKRVPILKNSCPTYRHWLLSS